MRRWRRLLLLLVARAVASAVTRFGLFDFESSPGAGWQLMSSADVTEHKAEFIAAYAKFQSGNASSAKAPHFMHVLASDIASPMLGINFTRWYQELVLVLMSKMSFNSSCFKHRDRTSAAGK